ncbi:MAG: phage tail protein [Bacteriovorax sp.]|nr:phage tail protein [Bacteriovorax sp.]
MPASASFGRDKLKGTTKTQGDFNLSVHFDEEGAVLRTSMVMPQHYKLEIDGVEVAGVHSVEGLESESDFVEYKDGEDGVIHTRPGNHKPGKMVITKDWSNTSEWYKWRKAVLDGKVERRSISVIFQNDDGKEAGRINLYDCWPVLWAGPELNAKSSGHAQEKIEISWETLELKAGK